jgi:DNA primase
MTDLIDQIRAALPIAPFVARYTNGLKPTGLGFFTGRCPFHQPESDPLRKRKLWVNANKGICGCFDPACQRDRPPMDVINFYARLHNITNAEAISELAKELGLK